MNKNIKVLPREPAREPSPEPSLRAVREGLLGARLGLVSAHTLFFVKALTLVSAANPSGACQYLRGTLGIVPKPRP